MAQHRPLFLLPFSFLAIASACGSNHGSGFGDAGGGGTDGSIILPGNGDGGTVIPPRDGGTILQQTDTGTPETGTVMVGDPTTCAEAATSKSYVGCDYWPTVTANLVWDGFDFTAVVANTQTVPASVTVTGPSGVSTAPTTVPANGLAKIYLPWVAALKGPGVDQAETTFTSSVGVTGGAYHLVSSVPVTVYQFNALEYKGTGGPPGKVWSACPDLGGTGCFSYSNDASVLIPTTAMTGNYRVTGEHGSTLLGGGLIAITGTQDGTAVTVTLSATAEITASSATSSVVIAKTGPTSATNPPVTFTLNAGDVVQLMGLANDMVDLSGSLVYATHPVQVIAGRQCANQPDPMAACDHLESSVLPAETLGKDYVVTVPTSPNLTVVGHKVRIYGNVNGTTLTYSPSNPGGCPTTINAGEVAECTGTADCATGFANDGTEDPVHVSCVTQTFEVTGNNEFAVSSFMLGGSAVDPSAGEEASDGDPSMSPMVATEQYRERYIFLAPDDYDQSYADVVTPPGNTLTLDGAPVTAAPTVINPSWSVVRILLGAGTDGQGAHLMTGTSPFGLQVIGYGSYTSYQYPGGLDLKQISVAPPPPVAQ